MPKLIDMSGRRYGRLLVLRKAPAQRRTGIHWYARCDCGVEKVVHGSDLRHGRSKSCGCLHAPHGNAAGGVRTRTYRTWDGMKERCLNPNHPHWAKYGGRGVTICARWLESFQNFLDDMGERPRGTTIDRYPNFDGNYEPGNCRWATPTEQAQNRRGNVRIGDAVAAEHARRLGLGRDAIYARIRRGWSPQAAVAEGDARHHSAAKGSAHYLAQLTDDGVREIRRRAAAGDAQRRIAEDFGLSYQTVNSVVRRKSWKHVD